jgi:hypothetical protein
VLEAAADLGPVPLVVGHATLEHAAVVAEAVLNIRDVDVDVSGDC